MNVVVVFVLLVLTAARDVTGKSSTPVLWLATMAPPWALVTVRGSCMSRGCRGTAWGADPGALWGTIPLAGAAFSISAPGWFWEVTVAKVEADGAALEAADVVARETTGAGTVALEASRLVVEGDLDSFGQARGEKYHEFKKCTTHSNKVCLGPLRRGIKYTRGQHGAELTITHLLLGIYKRRIFSIGCVNTKIDF